MNKNSHEKTSRDSHVIEIRFKLNDRLHLTFHYGLYLGQKSNTQILTAHIFVFESMRIFLRTMWGKCCYIHVLSLCPLESAFCILKPGNFRNLLSSECVPTVWPSTKACRAGIAATYTFKVETAQPISSNVCRYLRRTAQSNSLGSHSDCYTNQRTVSICWRTAT